MSDFDHAVARKVCVEGKWKLPFQLYFPPEFLMPLKERKFFPYLTASRTYLFFTDKNK